MSIEREKQVAAEAAAELVENSMTVGLGTGSTVAYLLPALARRSLDILCAATSPRTEHAARALGLRIEDVASIDRFDLTIDGADQVAPDGWLVKGGGGAHTREKIVAGAADRFVVIADSSKPVPALHGLIVHEHLAGMYGFELAGERRASVHIRPVGRLLDQIVAEDGRSLDVAREPSARVPGNCRHFTVLTVAALRAHGIPARARCGFGGYFGTGWYEDHWVCEYWNATAGHWTLADAQIDDVQRKAFGVGLDVLDVSRDDFLIAGDAWLRCRAGLADPGKFGASALDEAGYWWIAANLLRDVAALNNMEMLPWDIWGEMLRPDEEPDEAQVAFFDQLATLTTDPAAGFAELTTCYQADPRLTVPATVYNGVLKRVDEV